MTKKICTLLLLAILLPLLLTYPATAEPTDQYYSSSITLDGAYDYTEVMFSWTPALLPGYNIDTTNISCVGAVRVGLSVYRCVNAYNWYWDDLFDRYYFFATVTMPTLCGGSDVTLQPFLDVYNPTSGARDRIYGNMESTHFFCYKSVMPIIMNSAGSTDQTPWSPYP